MILLYEILLGVGLALLLRWLYRLMRAHGVSRALAGAGAGAVLAAFASGWVLRADWGLIGRIGLVLVVVGLGALVYARLIARLHRAAAKGEAREAEK